MVVSTVLGDILIVKTNISFFVVDGRNENISKYYIHIVFRKIK